MHCNWLMARNLTQQLIESHLVEGEMRAGEPIAIRMDQTLTQDATGTLVMLALEALLGDDRVRTELSAQYVDHNLLHTDEKNGDDHLFLLRACRKFGVHFSPPGNGVSHPLHMQSFGRPGKTLIGSDSHTPAAGSLGMFAFGAGGADVAAAMCGEPFHMRMPRVFGVELSGRLPDWVSAKDVILEMLRRHGVRGARGAVIEYYGPGLEDLSAMDRHVIANMGTELGATTSVFPADDRVRRFMRRHGRLDEFVELAADDGAPYDMHDAIDLGRLEPLIALPSSPGKVKPVREVAGRPIYQAYIGSSANPGLRDFAVPALMSAGRRVADGVSLDINPTSRELLESLSEEGLLMPLLSAGARLHQAGCNGCIGMGQAPATRGISLRTVPRNFPGRSGTADDEVYLCSPETAMASALTGKITDPRELGIAYPQFRASERQNEARRWQLVAPPAEAPAGKLEKAPHIASIPDLDRLPDALDGPVLLKLGDDVSTDEILPGGAEVLPFRSNVAAISRFVFRWIDEDYPARAEEHQDSGSFIVAGDNYGQGSSREHAALAPRYLGLRAVLAKSFARIHRQNLINYGVLPLLVDGSAYDSLAQGDRLHVSALADGLEPGRAVAARREDGSRCAFRHDLDERELNIVRAGGLINYLRQTRRREQAGSPRGSS